MISLTSQHRGYAKGSKEDVYTQAAYNARNKDSNQRNNLRRSINRIYQTPTLFDVADITADQRAALDYWQGTPYAVPLNGLRG